MREWIATTLAGALGGFAATVLAERVHIQDEQSLTSTTSGNSQADNTNASGWQKFWGWFWWVPALFEWTVNTLISMLGGALASFILWATYTSSLDFASRDIHPAEIAAAITVGLTGVGTVRGFMHETSRAREWEESAKRTMKYLMAQGGSVGDNSIDRAEGNDDNHSEGEVP